MRFGSGPVNPPCNPAKIFRAEHIVAIAASVGRPKDKARIEQLFQQADLDKTKLEKSCDGIN